MVAACQHLNQAANAPLSSHPQPTKPLASFWTKINTVYLPLGLYTTAISSFPVVDVVDEKRTPLLDESVEEEETYFHDSFNVINHEMVGVGLCLHYDVEWRKSNA